MSSIAKASTLFHTQSHARRSDNSVDTLLVKKATNVSWGSMSVFCPAILYCLGTRRPALSLCLTGINTRKPSIGRVFSEANIETLDPMSTNPGLGVLAFSDQLSEKLNAGYEESLGWELGPCAEPMRKTIVGKRMSVRIPSSTDEFRQDYLQVPRADHLKRLTKLLESGRARTAVPPLTQVSGFCSDAEASIEEDFSSAYEGVLQLVETEYNGLREIADVCHYIEAITQDEDVHKASVAVASTFYDCPPGHTELTDVIKKDPKNLGFPRFLCSLLTRIVCPIIVDALDGQHCAIMAYRYMWGLTIDDPKETVGNSPMMYLGNGCDSSDAAGAKFLSAEWRKILYVPSDESVDINDYMHLLYCSSAQRTEESLLASPYEDSNWIMDILEKTAPYEFIDRYTGVQDLLRIHVTNKSIKSGGSDLMQQIHRCVTVRRDFIARCVLRVLKLAVTMIPDDAERIANDYDNAEFYKTTDRAMLLSHDLFVNNRFKKQSYRNILYEYQGLLQSHGTEWGQANDDNRDHFYKFFRNPKFFPYVCLIDSMVYSSLDSANLCDLVSDMYQGLHWDRLSPDRQLQKTHQWNLSTIYDVCQMCKVLRYMLVGTFVSHWGDLFGLPKTPGSNRWYHLTNWAHVLFGSLVGKCVIGLLQMVGFYDREADEYYHKYVAGKTTLDFSTPLFRVMGFLVTKAFRTEWIAEHCLRGYKEAIHDLFLQRDEFEERYKVLIRHGHFSADFQHAVGDTSLELHDGMLSFYSILYKMWVHKEHIRPLERFPGERPSGTNLEELFRAEVIHHSSPRDETDSELETAAPASPLGDPHQLISQAAGDATLLLSLAEREVPPQPEAPPAANDSRGEESLVQETRELGEPLEPVHAPTPVYNLRPRSTTRSVQSRTAGEVSQPVVESSLSPVVAFNMETELEDYTAPTTTSPELNTSVSTTYGFELIKRNVVSPTLTATVHPDNIFGDRCQCVQPEPTSGRWCNSAACTFRATKCECGDSCKGGDMCANQRIRRNSVVDVEVIKAGAKGFGLVSRTPVNSGDLVREYMGKLLTKRPKNAEYLFLLQSDPELYLDARLQGDWSRFINHSCDPNCLVERWIVSCSRIEWI